MNLALSLFLFLWPIHNIGLNNALNSINKDTRSIKIGNINCSRQCIDKNLFYCDSMAIFPNGKFANSLELPLQSMLVGDVKGMVQILVDSNMYNYRSINNGVIEMEGEVECFYPTVAMLFINADSVVFAQILMDVNCRKYLLYSISDGRFVSIANQSNNKCISFYRDTPTILLKKFKKYRLKCISEN